MKYAQVKQRFKVIEFAVVGFATWLNPEAKFLLFLLKLCFQILEILQHKEKAKEDILREKPEIIQQQKKDNDL